MSAPHHRQAHVQGLRALAVVTVVAYHARVGMSGGFIGVDVFFVISGFVISRLLLRELEATNNLRLAEFFSRRTRRLLPALTLTLLVTCGVATFLLSPLGPQQQTADTATGAGLFGANVQLFGVRSGYFDLDSETNALLHTWSLGVEEQFYLLFPFAMLFVWRWRSRQVLLGFVALGSIASFGLSWLTSHGYLAHVAHALGGGVAKFAFYLPFTRAWEFGIGILVGIGVTKALSRPAAITASIVGLGAIFFATFALDHDTPFPGTAALVPTLGTALLLVGGSREDTIITRLLGTRPLVWIGDLSYSWYLWHWPPIVIARAWFPTDTHLHLLAAIGGLVPAWLSYRFVEQPLRVAEWWRGRRALLLVLACIALSVGASRLLAVAANYERDTLPRDFVAAALEPHAGAARGCTNGPGEERLERCASGSATLREVFLVGDSNADHFSEPFETAARTSGYRSVLAARTACPFVDALVDLPGRSPASCRAYVRSMVDLLVRRRPALVMIASASSVYVNGKNTTASELTAGLRAVVERLTAADIRVIVVHTIPNLVGFALATCPYARVARDESACDLSMSRTSIELQQRPARGAELAAIDGLANTSTLDLTEHVCGITECTARRGDIWLYRDEGHLSVAGAKSLTPVFERAMEGR